MICRWVIIFIIRNHPLYKFFEPSGAWGGEHSFVLEINSRSIKEQPFEASFKVAGHGLSGTILELATDMLNIVSSYLSGIQDITIKHLKNLETNGLNPSANVKIISRKEGGIDFNFFEYDLPYEYTVYSGLQSGINMSEVGNKLTMTTGFVIKQKVNDEKVFLIANFQGHDSSAPPQPNVINIYFLGPTFNSTTRYKLGSWGIKYYNVNRQRNRCNTAF